MDDTELNSEDRPIREVFVIHIYRVSVDNNLLVGTIEKVGSSKKDRFKTDEELISLIYKQLKG